MSTTEYFNITLETIDQCISDFFDVTVDAHVAFPNGERKKVPVQFSSAERAVSSRQKAIRDKNGVLILPLINISRTSIQQNSYMQALGTETPTLQINRQISGETNNLRNIDKLRDPGRKLHVTPVVYEVTSIPFPDRVICDYKLSIQAQYTIQMNSIIEKILNQLDIQKSFVAAFNPRRQTLHGDNYEDRPLLKGGYVMGFMEDALSDTGNLQEFTDQQRIVLYETTISVPATLQLDPEGVKSAIIKEYTAYKVEFPDEKVKFCKSFAELELIFNSKTGIKEG